MDTDKLVRTIQVFIADIERATEQFLGDATEILAENQEYHTVTNEDGYKMVANGNELAAILETKIPKLKDLGYYMDACGFDFNFLMDELSESIWQAVK